MYNDVRNEPIKLKNGHVVHQGFDDVSDLLAYIQDDHNTAEWRYSKASRSLENHRNSWYGTERFEDAVHLLRFGWPEGRDKILDGAGLIPAVQSYAVVPSINYDVAGGIVDVPEFCAGNPECMLDVNPISLKEAPIIRLWVSCSFSAMVSPELITNFGICMLSAIDALESAGYQLEVKWVQYAESENLGNMHSLTIKHAGQQVDADLLAFAIAHPSMLRRISFHLTECLGKRKHGDINFAESFYIGYGTPTKVPKEMIDPQVTVIDGNNMIYSRGSFEKANLKGVQKIIDYVVGDRKAKNLWFDDEGFSAKEEK